MIRISNLRLSVDEPEATLPAHLARALGVGPEALAHWRILRKSLDARVKEAPQFVYTAEVATPEDEALLVAGAARGRHGEVRVERHEEPPFVMPPRGAAPLEHRPVVVGSGPAGLVA